MDGRKLSDLLKPHLRAHAQELSDRYGVTPALAAVMVGDNPASAQYVRNKRKFAEELGFRSEVISIAEAAATTDHLLDTINRLNADDSITGILLQLPVPEGIDTFRLFDAIDADKDVDAVGAASLTGFYRGHWGRFIPCTPRGVLRTSRRGDWAQRHCGQADGDHPRRTAAQCDGYLVSSSYSRPRRDLPPV
jgi:methylenetetrahydrofolate dehydrogenase (NADP+)/methenyltetrahydrofolate cyclohydrolase